MKRKLLSFSMALCLSAMGVSAFAQTNKCTCTLNRVDGAGSTGTAARLEVSDEILGKWIGQAIDARSNKITLEGWVNFKSTTQDESADNDGLWYDSGALSTGRVLMGHRQGDKGGYASAPSFSISVVGLKNSVYQMSLYSREDNGTLSVPSVDMPEGWFHLALVGEITEDYTMVFTMYVNGKPKQTLTKNGVTRLPYLSDNTTDNWGCDISFGGSMECEFDDLMIWNKALTESEVRSSINGYADGSFPEGLIGYYLCDDMYPNAISENLLGGDYQLTLQGLTYGTLWTGAYQFTAKAPLSPDRIKDITPIRQFKRGAAPTFAEFTTWLGNGNEAGFKYAVNTTASPLTIVDGYSADNITMSSECVGVYYNSDIYEYAPALVTTDMYQEGAPTTAPEYSYLKGGFDYAVTMPATAREWMTIGFPSEVNLVSDGSYLLCPAYNFWYSELNTSYTDMNKDLWISKTQTDDVENDRNFILSKAGIISVPDNRVGQTFTFYTVQNIPVVFRAQNSEYNKTLLPESGKLGLVENPYMSEISTSDLCPGCTVYVLGTDGMFWPTKDAQTVSPFSAVLVYNGNSATAPKAVNTKTTTGVLELEALSDINVRGAKESIEVVTFEPATVTVYTVGGTMVANAQVEGTETFALPAGIYVVKAVAGSETKTFKVVVE